MTSPTWAVQCRLPASSCEASSPNTTPAGTSDGKLYVYEPDSLVTVVCPLQRLMSTAPNGGGSRSDTRPETVRGAPAVGPTTAADHDTVSLRGIVMTSLRANCWETAV
jgi:hypothetical protein